MSNHRSHENAKIPIRIVTLTLYMCVDVGEHEKYDILNKAENRSCFQARLFPNSIPGGSDRKKNFAMYWSTCKVNIGCMFVSWSFCVGCNFYLFIVGLTLSTNISPCSPQTHTLTTSRTDFPPLNERILHRRHADASHFPHSRFSTHSRRLSLTIVSDGGSSSRITYMEIPAHVWDSFFLFVVWMCRQRLFICISCWCVYGNIFQRSLMWIFLECMSDKWNALCDSHG